MQIYRQKQMIYKAGNRKDKIVQTEKRWHFTENRVVQIEVRSLRDEASLELKKQFMDKDTTLNELYS